MGSKGSKPRKPSHSQHLPKVGTPEENEREQRGARHAVSENISFGGRRDKSPVNGLVAGIGIVLIFGALAVLTLFFVFR